MSGRADVDNQLAGRACLMVAVLAAPAVLPLTGCAPCEREESSFLRARTGEGAGAVSEAEALKIADKRAAEAVAEFNERSPHRPPDGGPFKLEDYDKTPKRGSVDRRPLLSVDYKYGRFLGVRGGATHFSVWVYLDTGEARFFGGR